MPAWNRALFLLINASAHPPHAVVAVAKLFASSPVVVVPLLLVILWVWGRRSARGGLLAAAVATIIALGINVVLGAIYAEPRPFVIELGRTLIHHAADNAFPSDHATLVWALAAGLFTTGAARRWGLALAIYGLGVAWGRIFLGVHYPLDMIGSAVVAVVAGGIALVVRCWPVNWLLPAIETLYERVIRALRLPPALVPRARG